MLERIGGVLAEVGLTVRAHHERWDGGGYPDGLGGEEIPLNARIICACDAFSAMTTEPHATARRCPSRRRSPSCAPARAPSSTATWSRRSRRSSPSSCRSPLADALAA